MVRKLSYMKLILNLSGVERRDIGSALFYIIFGSVWIILVLEYPVEICKITAFLSGSICQI